MVKTVQDNSINQGCLYFHWRDTESFKQKNSTKNSADLIEG